MCDQTYGEKLVSFDYDYTKDEQVIKIKSMYADIIDSLKSQYSQGSVNTQRDLYIAESINQAVTACMRAVKAIASKSVAL